MFRKYETADISGKNVDHRVDMCNLPFTDGSFDFVAQKLFGLKYDLRARQRLAIERDSTTQ